MPSKHSTAGEAARSGWHHNTGDKANIKWLLPTWAGCLYNEDHTNRRWSIPRWQGPALGLLQFPVSFPQQKGASGPLHWGSAWSVGARSKPGGFGHPQAERCLPLGWPWALPWAFMDLMELRLPCGWSHAELTALTPIHYMAVQRTPRQSQQLTQVSPVSGHRGCASTRVCERGALCTLRGHLQTTSRDLLHLFLCTSLPPSAAPGAGSAFNTTGKIVTGRTLQQDKMWQ